MLLIYVFLYTVFVILECTLPTYKKYTSCSPHLLIAAFSLVLDLISCCFISSAECTVLPKSAVVGRMSLLHTHSLPPTAASSPAGSPHGKCPKGCTTYSTQYQLHGHTAGSTRLYHAAWGVAGCPLQGCVSVSKMFTH